MTDELKYGAVFGPVGKPGMARELITDMLGGYPESDLREYQEKYVKQSEPLMAPEIAIARKELADRVELRLKKGGRRR